MLSSPGMIFRYSIIQISMIAMAVLAVYGHTLDVPFYLDDFSSIVENPLIYRQAGLAELWQYSPLRILTYLSLSWNYHFHQFQPVGYHLVNIILHFLTGLAVWGMLRACLRTPGGQGVSLWLPLLAALLFVLHPLQTQAVTYIVQRATVLASLFYLLTILAYVQARLATGAVRWGWTGLGLGLALAAFLSKSHSASLPLALVAVEAVFFQAPLKRLAQGVGLALVAVLLVWLGAALSIGYEVFSMKGWVELSRETADISRFDYLASQVQIIWRYIFLFIWPFDLHLDRDVALVTFAAPLSWLALAAHLALIGAAWYWRSPWVLFALLFYYIAHSVESSILPIRDLMFEHRSYLPNVGLSVVLALLILRLRWSAAVAVVLLLSLALLSWQRNDMWRDPVRLWTHNAALTPAKDRPWGILGKHLLVVGRVDEAAKALEYALALQRAQNKTENPLDLINLVVAWRYLERTDEALALAQQALTQPMPTSARAKLLVNQGNIYYSQNQFKHAEMLYRQALYTDDESLEARANLANVLYLNHHLDEAAALYEDLLRVDPRHPQFRANYLRIREALAQRGSRDVKP
jgi:protein O-mannosyl-transferase